MPLGYAARSLAGEALTREQARAVLATPAEQLGELLGEALSVRERTWGRRVKICVLQNARSGLCPEDCGYCSQSKVSTADIQRYSLLSQQRLVAGANDAVARGARRYCCAGSCARWGASRRATARRSSRR